MAKKTDKKPVKKPAKKQPTQKQSQKQSVIINLGESKKKVRVRRKAVVSEKKDGVKSSTGITLYTANYATPPTYNTPAPSNTYNTYSSTYNTSIPTYTRTTTNTASPTYNMYEPQRVINETLPLSFYETNRPLNMGFDFTYPTVVPIATQTESELVPTLENQLDNNLEIVNNESSDLPTTGGSVVIYEPSIPVEEENRMVIFEPPSIRVNEPPSSIEPARPAIARLTQIQNPFTGRMINVGSNMFKKLMKKKIIDANGNIIMKQIQLEYLIEEYKLGRFRP